MNEQSRGTFDLSVTLSTLADPAPPAVSEWEFETVKHWAKDCLSKSHPNLGRTGAVCPFTGTSIKKNLFWVAFVRGNNLDHERMVGLLEEIAAAFPVLPPVDGPESIYKAVVLVFPEVTEFGQIDAVQDECKNAFVKRGLMVGQFYPGHQQGGLRNPDFRPLDAPFAMLAVRHMVVTDYPFLCGNEKWMVAYVARFAPDIPSHARSEIVKRFPRGAAEMLTFPVSLTLQRTTRNGSKSFGLPPPTPGATRCPSFPPSGSR